MALGFDISHAFRFPDEIERLVAGVYAAGSNDESSWIEWKERLDLSDERNFQHLPHTVLGFANREPATAAQWAEGYAYLIVGVEPGKCSGVTPIDPGDLSDRLRAYIGDEICWHPQYVTYASAQVLVIAVEPPKPGDPIRTLRKRLRDFNPGTIFTRLSGQTVQASPDHIKMLESRIRASVVTLDVTVDLAMQPRLEVPAAIEDRLDLLTERLRDRLIEHPTVPGPDDEEQSFQEQLSRVAEDTRAGMAALKAMGYKVDTRTLEEYNEEVEDYTAECARVLRSRFAIRQAQHAPCQLALRLVNNTDRNFTAVEVSAEISSVTHADFEIHSWPKFPDRPKPYGNVKEPSWLRGVSLGGFAMPSLSHLPAMLPPRRPLMEVDGVPGGVRIEFAPVDLRPRQVRNLVTLPLEVQVAEGGGLTLTWHATAGNVDGQLTGSLSLTAVGSSFRVESLLEEEDVQAVYSEGVM